MSLLNATDSDKVRRALRSVRDLLDDTARQRFVCAARKGVTSRFETAVPSNAPCRSVLQLVKLVADLARSNAELRKVVAQRGKLIEELREICDPGRERAVFAQTNRIAIPREGDRR